MLTCRSNCVDEFSADAGRRTDFMPSFFFEQVILVIARRCIGWFGRNDCDAFRGLMGHSLNREVLSGILFLAD